MIFLRQKQFNTPRIVINHRNRSRSHIQRHLQHQQIIRQNAIDLSTGGRTRRTNSRSQYNQDEENIRSMALNEKLASIGGLFGAVNIIITGALLYSIFTAKPEDKWWYISGVILNISFLIILMIGAILFDRFYLKRFTNPSLTVSPPSNSRIVNTNPTLLTYPTDSRQFPLNHSDVPPQYPGYLNESNPIKTEFETISNSRLISTNTSIIDSQNSFNSGEQIQINETNEVKNEINDLFDTASGKQVSPPNYFDLYPKQGEDTNESIPSTSTTITASSTESTNR